MRKLSVVTATLLILLTTAIEAADLQLPADIPTFEDGRAPIEELCQAYTSCWAWLAMDVIAQSHHGQRSMPCLIALRSPHPGKAVWILAGMHGEEPAGPNAIAASIEAIAELGAKRAVVLLPLNNPHGYARNWRYLNMPVYSAEVEGVGLVPGLSTLKSQLH
jgi:hypothetical protein